MSVLEKPPTRLLNLRASPAAGDTDASDRRRQANEFMRTGLAHFDVSEPIPFFCECGWEQCFKPVWLTGADYDYRRQNEGWRPTADGHDAADLPIRAVRSDG